MGCCCFCTVSGWVSNSTWIFFKTYFWKFCFSQLLSKIYQPAGKHSNNNNTWELFLGYWTVGQANIVQQDVYIRHYIIHVIFYTQSMNSIRDNCEPLNWDNLNTYGSMKQQRHTALIGNQSNILQHQVLFLLINLKMGGKKKSSLEATKGTTYFFCAYILQQYLPTALPDSFLPWKNH